MSSVLRPPRWIRRAAEGLAIEAAGVLLGGRFPALLRELQYAQWLSETELQARAESRLARLLKHAAETVPFYRKAYQRLGLSPDSLRTLKDLQRLPVVNKSTILNGPRDRFLAAGMPQHAREMKLTSGSTGEPFAFAVDRAKLPLIFASHLFYDSWYGLRPFDRGIRVTSSGSPALPSEMPLGVRFHQEVSRRLRLMYQSLTLERITLWSFDQQQAEDLYQRIEALRPAYIYSNASTLAGVADMLSRQDCQLHRSPRCVISIAESLTPQRRHQIERYFGAPISNRYGLREQGYWCAQSCLESPEEFHVNTELGVLEVVRQDGMPADVGEIGRLVMTDFHNYTMPFIRYDTGDRGVAVPGQCHCGRGFPRIGPIDGRSLECIQTPSGKIVTPSRFSHFLFAYKTEYNESVRQYQLEWSAPDHARLLVVTTENFSDDTRKRLRDDTAWILGDNVAVSVETVREILPEQSGKRPTFKMLAQSPKR